MNIMMMMMMMMMMGYTNNARKTSSKSAYNVSDIVQGPAEKPDDF